MKIRGTWRCYLCNATGADGRDGYQRHYNTEHFERQA
jgi:hypothetical protein